MCQNHCKTQQHIGFGNFSLEAAEAARAAGVVSASAARTPPSTRAGGQDDGRHKLRQIIPIIPDPHKPDGQMEADQQTPSGRKIGLPSGEPDRKVAIAFFL
jgi:hypothetical protein